MGGLVESVQCIMGAAAIIEAMWVSEESCHWPERRARMGVSNSTGMWTMSVNVLSCEA